MTDAASDGDASARWRVPSSRPHGAGPRSLASGRVGRALAAGPSVRGPCAHVAAVEATPSSHRPHSTRGKTEAEASRATGPRTVQLMKSRAGSRTRAGPSS